MEQECLGCSSEIETLGCGLMEPELVRMREFSTSLEIKKKEIFIREGNPQDFYYQIFYGVAGTYNYLPNGKRIITEILFAGDFIGPHPNNTYPFTAEALRNVYLCRFEKKKMDALIRETPALKDKLYMFQQNAINKARTHLLSISHKAPQERLVAFLLFLSSNIKPTGKNLTIPMGRTEIADYLGLTSETVSRTMTQLEDEGIIAMETPSQITLCDAAQLFEIVYGSEKDIFPYDFGHLTVKLNE